MGPYNYIAIEGNIGAGKTTLSELLARDHGAKLVLEQFSDNPFLPKFYEDRDKYAFPLEMSFLAERFQQLSEQIPSGDLFSSFTVSDYFVLKSLIFAEVNLPRDEFELYRRIFNLMYKQIPKPDLLVYLHRDVDDLQRQIKLRGRSYEQDIPNDYLEDVQRSYFAFLKQQKDLRILVLELGKLDFVNQVEAYEEICSTIVEPRNPGMTIQCLG
ncbi:deoxynucleoside kinase [Cryomorphaceae bacterium]|nr:deoxynucleoside kinase [Cryomorphaceae bacterium]